MIATGLDRLLAEVSQLGGRKYGVLAHAAAVTQGLRPIHLALAEAGQPPAVLFAPEHGFYAVEQDMVPSADQRDPWSGAPVLSLYGDDVASLRPSPLAFAGLDLLVIDLQDVGARYYTFAATAVWAAEAALAAGCEVWVLDRPNPLGGAVIEGNLPEPGFESFVGAFRIPVRHGLTLCELVRLQALRERWPGQPRYWTMSGWRRDLLWSELERPWIAPSPNMPSFATAVVYPGMCLMEATEFSEGRGTTRPFLLAGAPGVDAVRLATRLSGRELPGVCFLPTLFKPQFQKHGGEICAGVELAVTEPGSVAGYRVGIEVLEAFLEVSPEVFAWRDAPYEFVSDRPAIDLLSGGSALRAALESRASSNTRDWVETWRADERAFAVERRDALLYPEHA
ncbi:MAG: DUF1343 domain-containing protein [Acidobacteriota bacterium]